MMSGCNSGVWLSSSEVETFAQEIINSAVMDWASTVDFVRIVKSRLTYEIWGVCLDQLLEVINTVLAENPPENYDTAAQLLPQMYFTDSDGSLNFADFVNYLPTLSLEQQQAIINSLPDKQWDEFFATLEEKSIAFWREKREIDNPLEFDFQAYIDEYAVELAKQTPDQQLLLLGSLMDASPGLASLIVRQFAPSSDDPTLYENLSILAMSMHPNGELDAPSLLDYLTKLPPEAQLSFIESVQAFEPNLSIEDSLSTQLYTYFQGDNLRALLTDGSLEEALNYLLLMDEETRRRLRLPSNVKIMEETFKILAETSEESQVNFARGFLESWDKYGEATQLRQLQKAIAEMPDTILEISVSLVKEAYQSFHDLMEQRWNELHSLELMIAEYDFELANGEKTWDVKLGENIGGFLGQLLEKAPDQIESPLRNYVANQLASGLIGVNVLTEASFKALPFVGGVLDATPLGFLFGLGWYIGQGDTSDNWLEFLFEASSYSQESFWNTLGTLNESLGLGSPVSYDFYLQQRNTTLGGILYWGGFATTAALTAGSANWGGSFEVPTSFTRLPVAAAAAEGGVARAMFVTVIDGVVVVRVVPLLGRSAQTLSFAASFFAAGDDPLANWQDGEPMPGASEPNIDPRKFENYSMDPNNPNNGQKWRGFETLGYDVHSVEGRQSAFQDVLRQINEALSDTPATLGEMSTHGPRVEVRIIIEGPNGTQGTLVTVWQYDKSSQVPRLITNWLEVHK